MNALTVFTCSMLALSMAACSSDNSSNVLHISGDGSTAPIDLQTPEYRGELMFAEEQVVDLNAFLGEAGLKSVNAYHTLSQDGHSVRVDVADDLGIVVATALVDIATGQASWLAKELSPDTRILFDAQNHPVAVLGVGCQPVGYTPQSDSTFTDITASLESDQCISEYPQVSVNGNVIVFGTYDQNVSTQYNPQGRSLHAYTLDTASIVDFPDTSLLLNGVTLAPRTGLPLSGNHSLSDDGVQYFAGLMWEGMDSNGGTVREVGAVLINTTSGEWSTRSLANDARGCNATEKISCAPPYAYEMSNDGNMQFSMVPTDKLRDTGGSPFIAFETVLEQTGTDAPSPILVSGAQNASSLAVNADGSVVLLFTSTNIESEHQGFGLIQPETGDYVSLNRALNACPLTDDLGTEIDMASCQFTSVPVSITNSPARFTADGTTLIISSVSRFDSVTNTQIVEAFLIDVDEGAAYSMPDNFGGNLSGDASVILGISDYPEYNLLIGKR